MSKGPWEAGSISPAAFVPLLESTGLIIEVGEWVLERAALDCQQWRHDGLPPVHALHGAEGRVDLAHSTTTALCA